MLVTRTPKGASTSCTMPKRRLMIELQSVLKSRPSPVTVLTDYDGLCVQEGEQTPTKSSKRVFQLCFRRKFELCGVEFAPQTRFMNFAQIIYRSDSVPVEFVHGSL